MSQKIWWVKTVTVSAMTQVIVPVSTSAAGLWVFQNHPPMALKHLSFMGQSVIDEISHQLFTVYVSDFVHKPVYLSKHTTLSIALPSPAPNVTTG